MNDRVPSHVEPIMTVDVGELARPVAPVNGGKMPEVDLRALNQKRLARVRAVMRARGYGACILFDPYNQRYATGSRNMFIYFLRNATRYIYVPIEGPVIVFDYPGSAHVSIDGGCIDDVRESKLTWSAVQLKESERGGAFAAEIADLLRRDAPGEKRIGVDRCSLQVARAFERVGLEPIECQEDFIRIKTVKLEEEIACLQRSMAATELAVDTVRNAVMPGVTEQELFGLMMGTLIAQGGDFIKTRLLSAGARTNPWFNESGAYQVRAGDLVALDTDAIGFNGYYADFSRTFHCGPGKPTGAQKSLYALACEQIHHNMTLIKPGAGFREIAEKAWTIPDRYADLRYPSVMHGVGMHGEAPMITHIRDYGKYGIEGEIQPNMTIAVESYMGEPGGGEGVKLEQQVRVTETGIELFSTYPLEDELLERQI